MNHSDVTTAPGLGTAGPDGDLAVAERPPVLRPGGLADRIPVGRRGQLRALRRQLVQCDHAVQVAQRRALAAMRDESLTEAQRWDAVRRTRTLAWKVCREVLPLLSRVPPPMQAEPEFVECQRIAHALRRRTEAVLRDNANHTIDLIAAGQTNVRSI
jgi:hypothetical protein